MLLTRRAATREYTGPRSLALALAWAVLLCCAQGLLVSRAQAWCQASTETSHSGACVPVEGETLLNWTRGCMTLRYHESMLTEHEQLDEEDVRDIFDEAFLQWQEVQCPGEQTYLPYVVEFDPGTADSGAVEFLFDEPNESVVLALDKTEWAEAGYSSEAFAITFLWHNKGTGEIYDVDIAFNHGRGPFVMCGDDKCTNGDVDLQNTITHEAGHVFGLGHSRVERATMVIRAMPGDIFMRELAADDEEGMCALELPSHDCGDDGDITCPCPDPPIVSKNSTEDGCGCRLSSASGVGDSSPRATLSALLLPGLLALLGCRGRRRRRRRRRRWHP